jgi:DNA-directed RNA polymerase sigma subunit (sigma70/sigma32)
MLENDLNAAVARERVRLMAALIDDGKTIAQIAKLYGITRQRAHYLVSKHFPEKLKRRKKK